MINMKQKLDIGELVKKHYSYLHYFGGSIGGILGMYAFRHKTKKWYFKYGFPLILIIQIILIIYLAVNGGKLW